MVIPYKILWLLPTVFLCPVRHRPSRIGFLVKAVTHCFLVEQDPQDRFGGPEPTIRRRYLVLIQAFGYPHPTHSVHVHTGHPADPCCLILLDSQLLLFILIVTIRPPAYHECTMFEPVHR